MRILKRLLVAAAGLLVMGLAAALIWASSSTSDAELAVEAYLQSSGRVTVSSNPWITFQPADAAPEVGFIFYPGGNVDHRAYAPTLFEIASGGFLVVDVEMPLNLAVLDWDQALDVMDAYPEVRTWVVGGHSLGGAMAARFASKHPDKVAGLVLWAACPAGSDDLSDSRIEVLSVFGTLDGLASQEEIENSITLLPPDTTWVPIEGGNHAQFGYYGAQKGDNPAEISRQAQQGMIIEATASFLAQFEE